ncbi:MAG: hypothetical protein JOY67_01785 [Hyphomicrobiales bacterium]|nr:hypothetical protein [Hyphomicrobiales bacterium]
MRAAKEKNIKAIVRDTLRHGFENVTIENVLVQTGVDRDGDPVLLIKVILEGLPKEQEILTMSSAVRRLRPKLARIGEQAFPLISYISNTEARAAKLATS